MELPRWQQRAVERPPDGQWEDARPTFRVARPALQQLEERPEVVLGQVGVHDFDRVR